MYCSVFGDTRLWVGLLSSYTKVYLVAYNAASIRINLKREPNRRYVKDLWDEMKDDEDEADH